MISSIGCHKAKVKDDTEAFNKCIIEQKQLWDSLSYGQARKIVDYCYETTINN